VKVAKEAAIDLFKELTKTMIDCAAVMGQHFAVKRKVRNKVVMKNSKKFRIVSFVYTCIVLKLCPCHS